MSPRPGRLIPRPVGCEGPFSACGSRQRFLHTFSDLRRIVMPARHSDAAAFHALHKEFLILPNAWDAASARVTQEAGAKAIATSSAAVAWAHGFADGHHFPVEKLI